ncbi:methionyl-tRNA formyltransferase [Zymobacter sp. IVIA_12111.31 C1]|uniref:methionyl-tRNA formyltransferase n=1 Tax=Zymobacter sp. IVIA_12111.31 C1 TaxID=3394854 RepID=UPI0039C33D23
MSSSLRLAFAGTPDFAASSLAALLASQHNVVCVYTQPDRPAGRGRKPTASAVKQLAEQHGIPVHQPERLKTSDTWQPLVDADIDVLVVAAYGLILPKAVLDIPRLGALNIHASLLPRWRGAAPIQRAIAAGDTESGVTIMQMDEGLDTGDMLLVRTTPITDQTTGGDLHDTLAVLGGEAIVEALDRLAEGRDRLPATPQPEEGVTYASKLSKAEAELDLRQNARTLAATVRAFAPWPVAWARLNDDVVRFWHAQAQDVDHDAAPGTLLNAPKGELHIACGTGVLCVTRLQLPGGKPLAVRDVMNSRADRFQPGFSFTLPEDDA